MCSSTYHFVHLNTEEIFGGHDGSVSSVSDWNSRAAAQQGG